MSLPPEKAASCAICIAAIVKARCVSHQQLEGIVGELSFIQTQLFAKFGRAQLRPLYQKLYREVYNADLTDLELRIFKCWEVAIRSSTPMRFRSRPKSAQWILYTEEATNSPKIRALFSE